MDGFVCVCVYVSSLCVCVSSSCVCVSVSVLCVCVCVCLIFMRYIKQVWPVLHSWGLFIDTAAGLVMFLGVKVSTERWKYVKNRAAREREREREKEREWEHLEKEERLTASRFGEH